MDTGRFPALASSSRDRIRLPRYPPRSMRLFVYGSLLFGEIHNARLGGSRLLGEARTEPRYTLVDLGPYPALLDEGTTSVSGELY
jgi:gamma-glutamylcyclotransferase (GGCT)/AIG2-like uncharacterized protein YtfP